MELPAIDRRTVLMALGATTLFGAASTPRSSRASAAARPNIVVIMADDIGYTDIGCYGSEIATPSLDALADNGLRITQMYNNARCCPTRASLLTGLYPTQTGVGFMTEDQCTPQYQGYLDDNCVTIAQVLGQAGYRTAISGKWHVSPWAEEYADSQPVARGFDRSFCNLGPSYFRPGRYLNGQVLEPSPDDNFYFTERMTGHAMTAIRDAAEAGAEDGRPFFSYVAYTAPHFPLHAWERDIAPYRDTYLDGWHALRAARFAGAKQKGVVNPAWEPVGEGLPDWGSEEHKDWQDARMAVYAAQITKLDKGIGNIVQTLDTAGVLDNTVILFLGDNGASAEERPGNAARQDPGPECSDVSIGAVWADAVSAPFRRYKRWTYEGGLSSPSIAHWGNRLSGYHRSPLHVMDVMPTVLDLAGAQYPSDWNGTPITPAEGQSFANLLAGQSESSSMRSLCWEHMGNRAIRRCDWKLVSEYDQPWKLHHIPSDRTERYDVSADNETIVTELNTEWQSWKSRVGVRDWDPELQYRTDDCEPIGS